MKRSNKATRVIFSDEQVKEIRKLVKAGKTLVEVAGLFLTVASVVSRMSNRKTYAWVK